MTTKWTEAQRIERQFWDTYTGQHRADQRWLLGIMGVSYGFRAESVLDIGGGPQSVLLQIPKDDVPKAWVLDPLVLTFGEAARYIAADINYVQQKAEDCNSLKADEVWIYNCLQHVEDVAKTLRTAALAAAKRIRMVEWINEPIEPHHLHTITPADFRPFPPFVIEQEVFGTITTSMFEKQFMSTIWRRT